MASEADRKSQNLLGQQTLQMLRQRAFEALLVKADPAFLGLHGHSTSISSTFRGFDGFKSLRKDIIRYLHMIKMV